MVKWEVGELCDGLGVGEQSAVSFIVSHVIA